MLRRFRRTNQDPDTTPPLSVEAEAAAELRRVAEALGGSPPGVGGPASPGTDPTADPAATEATEATEEGETADSVLTPALDPVGKAPSEASSEATVRRVRKVPPAKGASAGPVGRAASRRGSA